MIWKGLWSGTSKARVIPPPPPNPSLQSPRGWYWVIEHWGALEATKAHTHLAPTVPAFLAVIAHCPGTPPCEINGKRTELRETPPTDALTRALFTTWMSGRRGGGGSGGGDGDRITDGMQTAAQHASHQTIPSTKSQKKRDLHAQFGKRTAKLHTFKNCRNNSSCCSDKGAVLAKGWWGTGVQHKRKMRTVPGLQRTMHAQIHGTCCPWRQAKADARPESLALRVRRCRTE